MFANRRKKPLLIGLLFVLVVFLVLNCAWFLGFQDPRLLFHRQIRLTAPAETKGLVAFSSQASSSWIEPSVYRFNLNGGEQQLIARKPANSLRISPDGNSVAYGTQQSLFIINREDQETMLDEICGLPVWSPDGRSIVCSHSGVAFAGYVQPEPGKGTWLYSIDGGSKEKLPLPDDHFIWDWSADGAWFLVSTNDPTQKFYLLNANDRVTSMHIHFAERVFRPRFSRDGKQILYVTIGKSFLDKISARDLMISEKQATLAESPRRLYLADQHFSIRDFGYSADGTVLVIAAYDTRTLKPGRSTTGSLQLLDIADGKRTAIHATPGASFLSVDLW